MSSLGSDAHAAPHGRREIFEFDAARNPAPRSSIHDRAILAAEDALAGMLILPGTGAKPRFIGNPPDWFANPVGDREYTWTLNRLEHWAVLLRAWRLNGERRYSDRVVFELRDWLRRCTCPRIDPSQVGQMFHDGSRIGSVRTMGRVLRRWPTVYRATQNLRKLASRSHSTALKPAPPPLGSTPCNTMPWRTLEAGVRMVHIWPMLLQYLPEIAPGDRELADQLRHSARDHGNVLATLSPLLWPNADHNHYLMECLGLLSVAVHFPDLPESAGWKIQAMAELERCASAQFTADGGHLEGCPHYHNVCVYLLARAFHVADSAGLVFSDSTRTTLCKSLAHCVQTLRPDGTGVPAGDSDADQLAVQATLFGYLATDDIAPLQAVTRLTGPEALMQALLEHPGLVGNPGDLIERSMAKPSTPPPLISWQHELKQATLRTDWTRDAISIFFACRTPIHNGHAHADPASFDLTALGQPILVDPGRLTYVDNADRRAIKSAAWHNTITIDRREPFEYLSTMHFAPQQHGTITGVIQQPNLLAAEACHHNFKPAIHRRLIAIIDQSVVLVLDRFDNLRRQSTAQIHYHLNSSAVKWTADRRTASAIISDVEVDLFTTAGLLGSDSPGKVSPSLGLAIDSVRLQFEDSPGRSHRVHATLIVPRRVGERQMIVEEFQSLRDEDTVRCSFVLNGREMVIDWTAASESKLRPMVVMSP